MQTAGAPDLDDLRQRFVAALLAGRRDEGLRVILDDGLRRGAGVPDLHLRVIQWAQHEIGRLWEENRCSIAQEHAATAISQLALAHLYPHLPRAPRNGRRVLLACVEGELHELGARIASDFLEMAGFDVHFVGANTPVESLVGLTKLERPDLLGLSTSLSFNMPALRQTIARAREELGRDFPVAVGGPAIEFLSKDAARELDVPVVGGDAAALAASVGATLGLS